MTELLSHLDTPSDAELISRVRGGDREAYGVLFERHVDSARRLARQLVRGHDADDLVSDAFAKVMTVLQSGGGPDVAFRAYLLTAVRRLHVDRVRAQSRLTTSDDMSEFDPGVPFRDTMVDAFESGAAARAFSTLPERWQLVLWHLEVEGQKPADVAPLLGMSANSVSALAYRAREGLRQAFLSAHLNDIGEADCRWVTEHLGGYVRRGLSKRDSSKVAAHLADCRSCTAMHLEVTEVNSNLAGIIAPLLLGSLAVGYVSGAGTGAAAGGLIALTDRAKDVVVAHMVPVAAGTAAASVAAVTVVGATTISPLSPQDQQVTGQAQIQVEEGLGGNAPAPRARLRPAFLDPSASPADLFAVPPVSLLVDPPATLEPLTDEAPVDLLGEVLGEVPGLPAVEATPSAAPTADPGQLPTEAPSGAPTEAPVTAPGQEQSPGAEPSQPVPQPDPQPTQQPTQQPGDEAGEPSASPDAQPSTSSPPVVPGQPGDDRPGTGNETTAPGTGSPGNAAPSPTAPPTSQPAPPDPGPPLTNLRLDQVRIVGGAAGVTMSGLPSAVTTVRVVLRSASGRTTFAPTRSGLCRVRESRPTVALCSTRDVAWQKRLGGRSFPHRFHAVIPLAYPGTLDRDVLRFTARVADHADTDLRDNRFRVAFLPERLQPGLPGLPLPSGNPTPTAAPSATPTAGGQPGPTDEPAPTSNASPSPEPSPSGQPSASTTPTPTNGVSPSAGPTASPTAGGQPGPTDEPTPTDGPTPSASPPADPGPANDPSPTVDPTPTVEPTRDPSASTPAEAPASGPVLSAGSTTNLTVAADRRTGGSSGVGLFRVTLAGLPAGRVTAVDLELHFNHTRVDLERLPAGCWLVDQPTGRVRCETDGTFTGVFDAELARVAPRRVVLATVHAWLVNQEEGHLGDNVATVRLRNTDPRAESRG